MDNNVDNNILDFLKRKKKEFADKKIEKSELKEINKFANKFYDFTKEVLKLPNKRPESLPDNITFEKPVPGMVILTMSNENYVLDTETHVRGSMFKVYKKTGNMIKKNFYGKEEPELIELCSWLRAANLTGILDKTVYDIEVKDRQESLTALKSLEPMIQNKYKHVLEFEDAQNKKKTNKRKPQ